MTGNCVFCRLVAGTLPGAFVHRDDRVVAFMDAGQVNDGHVIVATVRHVELPTKCPKCRRKIVEVSETNLCDGFIDGKLTADDVEDVAEFEPNSGSSWEYGENFIVVGFRCGRCHHILLEGAFHELEGD